MLSSVLHKFQSVFQHQDVQKSLEWMQTLSNMDEIDVLIETRQQLAKIQLDSIHEAKLQIDLVLQIDQKTYRYAKKETHKYLTVLKINKNLESNIYNAAYLYFRQLYVSYTQFLNCYMEQNHVVIEEDKINLILCRLLNAAFAMAKWRYFDDQPAPVGTWTNIHKVIIFAEKLAIMNNNLFLYNFERKETSIASILKRGFMLDTLHKGNYSRLQIQLTERILKAWVTNPLILNKYRQDKVQFFINLEGDKGPERIRAIEKFANYRFWKTTRVVDKIEDYLCAVDTQKPLSEFGLDKIAPHSVILKLFKKLRAEWCVEGFERQRRKEARLKNSKLLNVSFGLEDIYARLQYMHQMHHKQSVKQTIAEDEHLEHMTENRPIQQTVNSLSSHSVTNHLGTENWWMVDESSGGFAVDLGKEVNYWVEPGKLIGYTTTDNKETLIIAEIKSVRKQANGLYRAGLEIIGSYAEAVRVSQANADVEEEVQFGYFVDEGSFSFDKLNAFEGILLKNTNRYSGKNSLILPRNKYKRGNQYLVQVNGQEKLVQAKFLHIKQREWVGVECVTNS